MTLAGLLPVLGLYALTLFMPGPAKVLIVAIAVSAGRARALAAAYGVTLASVIWSSTAAFGFAAVLRAFPDAMVYLRWLGAGYLLWLSGMCFRAARRAPAAREISRFLPKTRGAAFLLGLTVHLTNPNAAFFWIGLFAFAARPGLDMAGLALIILLCGAMALFGFSAYAHIFAARGMKAGVSRARPLLALALGVIFAAAALRIIWQMLA
ncbi:MAG: LysE family transporter [Pseudomonadota bacterium]